MLITRPGFSRGEIKLNGCTQLFSSTIKITFSSPETYAVDGEARKRNAPYQLTGWWWFKVRTHGKVSELQVPMPLG